jgi:hypothetical protein
MNYGDTIVNLLKQGMANSPLFPYDYSPNRKSTRNGLPKPHMKDSALLSNAVIPLDASSYYFEIGNSNAEALTPHYHILEDAKIIRRANKSTKITRGSQDRVADKGKRNYGVWQDRITTQSKGSQYGYLETIQEYRQNQSRNFWGDAAKAREYTERVKYHHVYNRNHYSNVHWKYIERILEQLVPVVAISVNAKLVKTTRETLKDEWFNESSILLFNQKGTTSSAVDTMTGEMLLDEVDG